MKVKVISCLNGSLFAHSMFPSQVMNTSTLEFVTRPASDVVKVCLIPRASLSGMRTKLFRGSDLAEELGP